MRTEETTAPYIFTEYMPAFIDAERQRPVAFTTKQEFLALPTVCKWSQSDLFGSFGQEQAASRTYLVAYMLGQQQFVVGYLNRPVPDSWLLEVGERGMIPPIALSREELLADALCRVLIAAGVLRADASPSGPELLVAADDYCRHKAGG